MSKNKGFSLTSAERYSLALYELANDSNLLEKIENKSSSILDILSKSKDFSNVVKDHTCSKENLLKVIDNISENNKFETLLKNILRFLIERREDL